MQPPNENTRAGRMQNRRGQDRKGDRNVEEMEKCQQQYMIENGSGDEQQSEKANVTPEESEDNTYACHFQSVLFPHHHFKPRPLLYPRRDQCVAPSD